jgi:hypothetical protein
VIGLEDRCLCHSARPARNHCARRSVFVRKLFGGPGTSRTFIGRGRVGYSHLGSPVPQCRTVIGTSVTSRTSRPGFVVPAPASPGGGVWCPVHGIKPGHLALTRRAPSHLAHRACNAKPAARGRRGDELRATAGISGPVWLFELLKNSDDGRCRVGTAKTKSPEASLRSGLLRLKGRRRLHDSSTRITTTRIDRDRSPRIQRLRDVRGSREQRASARLNTLLT